MMPEVRKVETIEGITPAAMHELACAFAEEIFARNGNAPFMWIVLCGERLIWVETPWEDDHEKAIFTSMIASLIKKIGAQAYTCMVEAWVVVQLAGPDGKYPDDAVMPSDRPAKERDDVLMVMTQERDKPMMATRYLVTMRPPGLGKNYLGPRQDENDRFTSGAMVDLFRKARR